jgi:hypothetical protein
MKTDKLKLFKVQYLISLFVMIYKITHIFCTKEIVYYKIMHYFCGKFLINCNDEMF